MTCDLPLGAATEELTGFEVIGVEKHFGKNMDDLGAISLMMGVVWAYETRAAGKSVSWTVIQNMTIKALSEYFPPDPADEESELGKASSGDDAPIAT